MAAAPCVRSYESALPLRKECVPQSVALGNLARIAEPNGVLTRAVPALEIHGTGLHESESIPIRGVREDEGAPAGNSPVQHAYATKPAALQLSHAPGGEGRRARVPFMATGAPAPATGTRRRHNCSGSRWALRCARSMQATFVVPLRANREEP